MSADLSPIQKRCLDRWYQLKEHPVQRALVTEKIRFKVVPAGRRSGKTERAKRFLAKVLLSTANGNYFIGAPTRAQVKRIYWEDIKLLSFAELFCRDKISETELKIRYPNGNTLTLVGLDEPKRIEGDFWTGGLIDEIADIKPNAWAENIYPALDTFDPRNPTYKAWCWLIGVPDGLNHYYDMAERAKLDTEPDWALYHWKSSEILPPEAVEAARRQLSRRQFLQEYEASFETATGRIYEDYSDKNKTNETIQPHEQLHWFHDFNYTPMSSGIATIRNDSDVFIMDEIILTSAVARQSAMEFVDRYSDHKNKNIIVYGDPAGKAGEKHGHASDYTEIIEVLKSYGWKPQRRVRPKAPAIRDRQNAVRAKILPYEGVPSLFVNPDKAPYCDKGLATQQAMEGSTFQEEVTEYQHITTAIGYFVERNWPVTPKEVDTEIVDNPIEHYYGDD